MGDQSSTGVMYTPQMMRNQLLYDAMQNDDLQLVRKHISEGADVNAPAHVGYYPLSVATCNNNIALVKILIESGADVKFEIVFNNEKIGRLDIASYANKPLLNAIAHKNQEIMSLLLKNGANPNTESFVGSSPLMWAIFEYPNSQQDAISMDLVKELINAGADPDYVAENGYSALIQTIYQHEKECMMYLLEKGATLRDSHLCDLSDIGKDVHLSRLFSIAKEYLLNKAADQTSFPADDSSALPSRRIRI